MHKKLHLLVYFLNFIYFTLFSQTVWHTKIPQIQGISLHILLLLKMSCMCYCSLSVAIQYVDLYTVYPSFFFVCYNLCENKICNPFFLHESFLWVYRANNMVNIVFLVFISLKLHILTWDSWRDRCWLNIDFQILFEWLSNA